jgi:hypothetical protein
VYFSSRYHWGDAVAMTPDARYGIIGNDQIKQYHRSRRMFCVKERRVIVAPSGVDYSHAAWLETMGWSKDEVEVFIQSGLRGFVDARGDVCFYTGWDFRIDDRIEALFVEILPDLAAKLKLKSTANVYGGALVKQPGASWKPQTMYGTVGEMLKSKI